MSSLFVLDVGHGNATIYLHDDCVVVIDGAPGAILIDFLRERSIQNIDAVVVSHADYDHLAGIIGLLATEDFKIDRIIVGPDASKRSRAWYNFAVAVADASQRGAVRVETSLNRSQPGRIEFGDGAAEVIYPSAVEALLPAGSVIEDHAVVSNDTSAVLRVLHHGSAIAVLGGDITSWGIDRLLSSTQDLHARILVFPHHGGEVSSQESLADLLDAVSPDWALFSYGRSRYRNPAPSVVAACVSRGIRIACTQLSKHCVAGNSPRGRSVALISAGRASGSCCAGTMEFHLDGATFTEFEEHQQYVDLISGGALCRRKIEPVAI